MTYAEFDKICRDEEDWWILKSSFRQLNPSQFGIPSYRLILNWALRVDSADVSRTAAAKLVADQIPLDRPYGDVNEAGKRILKVAGVVRSISRPKSLIPEIVAYALGRPETAYDWKKYFDYNHKQAEKVALFIKQSREVDIDAFLVRLDSFCDLILEQIFKRVCPGKNYPFFGSAIKHPAILALVPDAAKAFNILHQLRLKSITAHPRDQKTGVGTRRLKHSDFANIRKDVSAAFDEIERVVIP